MFVELGVRRLNGVLRDFNECIWIWWSDGSGGPVEGICGQKGNSMKQKIAFVVNERHDINQSLHEKTVKPTG